MTSLIKTGYRAEWEMLGFNDLGHMISIENYLLGLCIGGMRCVSPFYEYAQYLDEGRRTPEIYQKILNILAGHDYNHLPLFFYEAPETVEAAVRFISKIVPLSVLGVDQKNPATFSLEAQISGFLSALEILSTSPKEDADHLVSQLERVSQTRLLWTQLKKELLDSLCGTQIVPGLSSRFEPATAMIQISRSLQYMVDIEAKAAGQVPYT